MGQGSSDDGVACSVMLEAIRYYIDRMQRGYTISNDLLFAFVNGEEFGMYGSQAMAKEFTGFDNAIQRTKFVTNLESRGTSGTLIMFETGKNNYNTVRLFSKLNKSLFTCSIATMVYDMMPNNTDFTTFKATYQGVNMANIGSGENYHTQNDAPDNVGMSYLSQQAQIVDGLIDKLGNYELSKLYDANESAIFFSYLNMTTIVYNHTAVIVFAFIGIVMLAANILLSIFYRKENNAGRTAKAIAAIVVGLIVVSAVTYACYFLFQQTAALFGVIDLYMLGTITYSNIAIVTGIGILALAITILTTHFASVNLQGKQNNAKLPWDDALVYVVDENGNSEYRIYDLNAYRALKKYAPAMRYDTDHYAVVGKKKDIGVSILSTFANNTLSIKKNEGKTNVYLTFTNETTQSFTIDDGTTVQTHEFGENKTWSIAIHSDCKVTVNGGTAKVDYKEVIRDYELLIPETYTDDEQLHFNLWLTKSYSY